jgi:hypothetical protein
MAASWRSPELLPDAQLTQVVSTKLKSGSDSQIRLTVERYCRRVEYVGTCPRGSLHEVLGDPGDLWINDSTISTCSDDEEVEENKNLSNLLPFPGPG